jgi:PAS domain S-box-containing protein
MSKTEAPSVLAVLGFTGIVEGIGYDGQPVVAAVVPIRDTPWFLISKINTSEIYAPLRERLWLMVAIVGLLLTGAALVIGVIWKHRSARFYREQKEAGELLRKSDRKYKELTEQASEGIFTVDHKGQYTDANPAGLQMLGYSFSDLKGMLLTDLIWREDLKNTPSELPEILSGKIVTTERTLIKGNGVRFQAEITSKLINDGSILVTKRDITERKKAEEELLVAKDRAEEATKLKDKFVEMVAHDLKSPFTSMLGCLKLLVERIPPLEDVNNQKIVDIIFKSGDRMLATIDDLLKVSRFRTGQITPQLSFFKGRMAVAVAIQSLSQNATEKGIEIINDVPMDMRLFADQSLFDEILINLLSNAIKFCSRGDRITCFTPPGLSSAIAIQDTGKGIHERNMLNLFKHEVKTSTVGTAGEIGTGLGLPFSHDIIKAHGGKLTVESAPGKGSVFCAELPYIKPIALVVDDDDLALEILREHLESIGLDVVCALNGEKALVALKDKRPHIIITDVNMPTMNGYTLLSLLKNDRATKEIPVIVITASDREAREKALMLGADDFVGKPVAIEEFIPRVRRFTG